MEAACGLVPANDIISESQADNSAKNRDLNFWALPTRWALPSWSFATLSECFYFIKISEKSEFSHLISLSKEDWRGNGTSRVRLNAGKWIMWSLKKEPVACVEGGLEWICPVVLVMVYYDCERSRAPFNRFGVCVCLCVYMCVDGSTQSSQIYGLEGICVSFRNLTFRHLP